MQSSSSSGRGDKKKDWKMLLLSQGDPRADLLLAPNTESLRVVSIAREQQQEKRSKQEREKRKQRVPTCPPSLTRSLSLFPLSRSRRRKSLASPRPPPRRPCHDYPFPFASTIEDVVKLSEAEEKEQAQGRKVLAKALPRGKG